MHQDQHSAHRGFDYEKLLSALEIYNVPSHPLPGPEAKLKKWTGKPSPEYNGFTGAEREYMWQVQRWVRDRGLYPQPLACAVCQRQSPPLYFHSENYADLWNAIPICFYCHGVLHQRFAQPTRWAKLLASRAPGDRPQWLDLLSSEPIDLAGWLRSRNVQSFLWAPPS